ncbi:hypothetical protein Tco_0025077 [Tanacetum coccineum]
MPKCPRGGLVTVVACAIKPTGCVEGVADGTLGPSTHILSSYRVYSSSKSIHSPSPLIIIPYILILMDFPTFLLVSTFLNDPFIYHGLIGQVHQKSAQPSV